MSDTTYRRLVLKLSGEILAGDNGFGIDPTKANRLAQEIKTIHDMGITIGLVIGAGNIFRGIQAASDGIQRVTGDYLGMLATIMNAVCVQDALENLGSVTRTLSAITVPQIAEPYIRRRALRHLEKGRIVIVAGGTGNPYFTTDTAAALRATELGAEVLIKGTKVDGVYDKDPLLHSDAKMYNQVSFKDVIQNELRVMDMTAISLCKENSLPIKVFNINKSGELKRLVEGEQIGTLVGD
tara:strand:- start:521 stop:1237 length:717 start_codon:yes stop_codon:yes gene_type:complete